MTQGYGVSIVVRGREHRLHGEGKQLLWSKMKKVMEENLNG